MPLAGWYHAAALLLAILLHEIGHLLAMLLAKTAVKSINFTAFGVHIVRSAVQFVPPLRLVVVYLAGPAVNLLLALLFLGSSREGMAGYFGAVNLLLGLLHLLPAGSLDGACALREALSFLLPGRWVKPVAGLISLAVLLGLVPVMGGLAGKISPTAMLLWVYLLVATFREY